MTRSVGAIAQRALPFSRRFRVAAVPDATPRIRAHHRQIEVTLPDEVCDPVQLYASVGRRDESPASRFLHLRAGMAAYCRGGGYAY
jgi:hypothetical protein